MCNCACTLVCIPVSECQHARVRLCVCEFERKREGAESVSVFLSDVAFGNAPNGL